MLSAVCVLYCKDSIIELNVENFPHLDGYETLKPSFIEPLGCGSLLPLVQSGIFLYFIFIVIYNHTTEQGKFTQFDQG